MTKIEELLHRRTDLSTFLVHLTRSGGGRSAVDNLESIIAGLTLQARTPFGPAAGQEPYLGGSPASQKAVCFTETPLEHVWMMLEEIELRSVQLEPYGIAITKATARRAGLNPVWYSDITRRGVDWPATAVNALIAEAVRRAQRHDGTIDTDLLQSEPIFKITPYFEQMGPIKGGSRKEFWWEREWRIQGDYYLSYPSRIVAILAPVHDHGRIETFLVETSKIWGNDKLATRPILDPRWGLERMIAALAKLPPDDIGPFPTPT